MIGIIGAMDEEVQQIIDVMTIEKTVERASMQFHCGMLEGKQVIIVRSGIGKVNAAICAQILVDLFGVNAIINTGIAGSLKPEINILDVVISNEVVHHDVDATAFGYPLGQVPRVDTLAFQADAHMIEIAKESCAAAVPEIHMFTGRVVSGDQFISDEQTKARIVENFDGFCTEMEGASIAQTAYMNHIPFVILRTISDKADKSVEMEYSQFEAKAIHNSVLLIKEFIRRI